MEASLLHNGLKQPPPTACTKLSRELAQALSPYEAEIEQRYAIASIRFKYSSLPEA